MAGGVRIGIAFDSDTLDTTPTWTYLTSTPNLAVSYSVDRGRQYEFAVTDTGTARVQIVDTQGVFDPTNSFGVYYTKIEPLKQIQIELWNPVALEYQARYRGFIRDYDYTIDPTQRVSFIELSCVDLFEICTAIEMAQGEFGDDPGVANYPDIFFEDGPANVRIRDVLLDAGIDDNDFAVIFDLNVELCEYSYSNGDTVLQVIRDAADAEFPTVSNVFCDRKGRLCVHGRLAKFDPHGTWLSIGATDLIRNERWAFRQWKVGDGTAVALSPTDTAHMRTFSFNRGLSEVFNSALCTPYGITDAQRNAQRGLKKNATSIGKYGIRSWSAESLLLQAGLLTGNDAITECEAFADYIQTNYGDPQNRITDITFRSMNPTDHRAAANWDLLCNCDIGDTVEVTVKMPNAPGWNLVPHFIEGVHEEVKALDGNMADVTLSLDLSPSVYFTTAGAAWPGH